MIAAIFGGLSLCILVYVNVLRPYFRSNRLRRAAKTFFIVPRDDLHDCSYAVQDKDEHHLKEISLPPDSEATVDMIVNINAPFSYSEIIVGFLGDVKRKPYFEKYFNRYVSVGKGQEIDPSKERDDDFIDKYFYYHRKVEKSVTLGMVISIAFKIKTRAEGVYPLHLYFVSNEPVQHENVCYITVEKERSFKLKCAIPDHKERQCAKDIGVKG